MIEFYGTASDEERLVSHITARDSEDGYLSPSEDKKDDCHLQNSLAQAQ